MDRYAIISATGAVINVTLWDGVTPWKPELGQAVLAPEGVGIGWRYEGGDFVAPVIAPTTPTVPAEVWTYQAKTVMALTSLESLGLSGEAFGLPAGATLYDAVLAAVASLPEQQRLIATIQLEGAPGTRRDAPLLASLAGPLGLTDAMIDQLFIAAAAVP